MKSKNQNKKFFLPNKILITFLIVILIIIGFYLHNDYGISIDEESTRHHGLVSLNYIIKILNNYFYLNLNVLENITELKNYELREYGVIFELFAAICEKIFFLKEYDDIFYFRHLLNHFIFLIGIYFFYKILFKAYNNVYLAIIGSGILYSTPRIFAQSFYNSKDIIFLSVFIVCTYFAYNFFRKKNFNNIFLIGFFIALLTCVRSIGFYFYLIIIFFLFLEFLDNKIKLNNFVKITFYLTFIYFLSVYSLWPFLWEDPISNFIYAIKSFSSYGWGGKVLYLGDFHSAKHLPWHYMPVWIFATISIPLSILIFLALIFTTFRFSKRLSNINFNMWNNQLEFFSLFVFTLIIAPIILIITNSSTLYNGWRHVYFIFPPLVILAIGFIYYTKIIFNKKKFLLKTLNVFLFIILLNNITNIIRLHPYQYMYFNFLFEKDANKNFEIDYWGLSNRDALIKLPINKYEKINVGVLGLANLEMSRKLLPDDLKKKINIVGENFNSVDFIVSTSNFADDPKYVDRYKKPENFKLLYQIKKGNIIINKVFAKN